LRGWKREKGREREREREKKVVSAVVRRARESLAAVIVVVEH